MAPELPSAERSLAAKARQYNALSGDLMMTRLADAIDSLADRLATAEVAREATDAE